jgi:hypothetical protein
MELTVVEPIIEVGRVTPVRRTVFRPVVAVA